MDLSAYQKQPATSHGSRIVMDTSLIYECGICSCYHRWEFNGDCREDEGRILDPDEHAKKLGVSDIEVRSWEDRCAADLET